MSKFYIRRAPRFIYEFTNWKYREIENNILMDTAIKQAILDNITKYFEMLAHDLISVNEYLQVLASIESFTIERM